MFDRAVIRRILCQRVVNAVLVMVIYVSMANYQLAQFAGFGVLIRLPGCTISHMKNISSRDSEPFANLCNILISCECE